MIKGCVSVIIPAYNVAEYVGRCIDSLLRQTYSNFELLVVDNNSNDNTAGVIKAYCEEDNRVKYIKCIEPGVCNARNLGIASISGEWFAFIDADDWVEPDFLQVLVDNAIETGASISACCYVNDNGSNIKNDIINSPLQFNSVEECIHNFICDAPSMEGMVWNKIYNTELYSNIKFDTSLRVNEDCYYTYEVFCNCKKACLTESKLYHWYFREESACRKAPEKLELQNADVFIKLLEKTTMFNDKQVEHKLKLEYVRIITKMLMNVRYRYDSKELRLVRQRLIEWKEDVYPSLNGQVKRYYNTMIKYPVLMDVFRIKNRIIRDIKVQIKKIIGR